MSELISISDIIGSCLATFFAILTWYIIESLTKYFEWKALINNFNKLYTIFAAKKYEPNTSIDVVTIILEDIGEKNFSRVMKLKYEFKGNIHNFEGNDFKIIAQCKIYGNYLKIEQYGKTTFDFIKPGESVDTYQNFMEYFETQCRIAGIKLKSSNLEKSIN